MSPGISPVVGAIKRVPQYEDVTGKHGIAAPRSMPLNWRAVIFRSSEPLSDSEQENRVDGHFPYMIFVREQSEHGTVVIAAKRYRITDAAVRTFNAYVVPRLQKRHIKVTELADRMISRTSKLDYYLTHLTADVPRFGAALRSISLTGDDLASSEFFNSGKKGHGTESGVGGFPYSYFTAKQIGLKTPGSSLGEFGRFGGTGTIQFPEDGISELEIFLNRVGV